MATSILDTETRSGVPKVLFIVTDGNSDQPFQTRYEALLTKLKGYYILILGIGGNVYLPELQSIASESDKVLLQPSFPLLASMDVTEEICTGSAL